MDLHYTIIITILFLATVIIHKICGNKRAFQKAFLTSCTGIALLVAINCTSFFTGISIPFSPLAIAISAFGGIPGITLILGLDLLF